MRKHCHLAPDGSKLQHTGLCPRQQRAYAATPCAGCVRSAAPFPAPIKMGKVTYTDTWLWHKSGQFQLDTLTEGQL